jgi:hypothetical protein
MLPGETMGVHDFIGSPNQAVSVVKTGFSGINQGRLYYCYHSLKVTGTYHPDPSVICEMTEVCNTGQGTCHQIFPGIHACFQLTPF